MTPTEPKKQPNLPPEEEQGFKKKVNDLREKLGNNQLVVYGLLVLGLFLLLFAPLWGGLLLGAIVGFTFSDEIIASAKRVKESLEAEEVSRGVVLGVLCLAFLLVAPAFILGAGAAVAIKKIVNLGDSPLDALKDLTKESTQKDSGSPKDTGAPKSDTAIKPDAIIVDDQEKNKPKS